MGRPNAFDGMMHEFCVKLGWCGSVKDGKPLHVSDFIPEMGPVSADELARWLITAEGFDLDKLSRAKLRDWMTQLEAVFVAHMGSDVVDASNLRSGHHGRTR
jgi:hypothetical protein